MVEGVEPESSEAIESVIEVRPMFSLMVFGYLA